MSGTCSMAISALGEVTRELVRVGERPGDGVDVDHGHGLAPFAPGYAGVKLGGESQPLTATHCSAAVAISCATSVGCETIATWLDGISMVVAPIRGGELALGVGREGLVVLWRPGTRTAATSRPGRPSRR